MTVAATKTQRWTKERRLALTRHWLDGATAEEISEMLGASEAAVFAMARRLQLPRRARTETGLEVPVLRADKAPVAPNKRQKIRDCLRCGTSFLSAHAGNRRCPKCDTDKDIGGEDYTLLV